MKRNNKQEIVIKSFLCSNANITGPVGVRSRVVNFCEPANSCPSCRHIHIYLYIICIGFIVSEMSRHINIFPTSGRYILNGDEVGNGVHAIASGYKNVFFSIIVGIGKIFSNRDSYFQRARLCAMNERPAWHTLHSGIWHLESLINRVCGSV